MKHSFDWTPLIMLEIWGIIAKEHNCKVGVSYDKMFFWSEGSIKGPATKHINRRFSLSDLDGGGGEGLARLLGAAGVTIAEPCKDELVIMANKSAWIGFFESLCYMVPMYYHKWSLKKTWHKSICRYHHLPSENRLEKNVVHLYISMLYSLRACKG